jgi:hypothetical protein
LETGNLPNPPTSNLGVSHPATAQESHPLDGWLPLRGRWLRYALWPLGLWLAPNVLQSAFLLVQSPRNEWNQLLLAAFIATLLLALTLRRTATTLAAPWRALAAVWGILLAGWTYSVAVTYATDLSYTCGFNRSATDTLYAEVPTALCALAVITRSASSPVTRIAACSSILTWLLAFLAIATPLYRR